MNIKHVNTILKGLKKPFVAVLIGPPLSGKDTLIRKLDVPFNVVSRDDILMEVAATDDYNMAYEVADQKKVDRLLKEMIVENTNSENNVIINMTNMTSKRRRTILSNFKNHTKVAIVFPILSDEEYKRRNEKRLIEEKKSIPDHVIKRMISQFQDIRHEEGFDKIITL